MKSRISVLFFGLIFFFYACTLPNSPQQTPQNPNSPNKQPPLVWAPQNATHTPTPFMPMAPTPGGPNNPNPNAPSSVGPNSTPLANTWGSYPGPSVPPGTAIPTPMGIFSQPAGQTNILLMGSDQRPFDGGFRTDVLLLVTINTELNSVNLTSFPRDLYVYLPGWTMERINTAQARGGFELTAQMFEYNFGVRPDHWALINFNGFLSIIDALGGISVQVKKTLTDHRDGYGDYTVYAGDVYMDGDLALWYVRARYTTSDFDRTRRQQEVLQAIFYRLISLNAIANATELYRQYNQTVLTNMTLDDILPFIPIATLLADGEGINKFVIGSENVINWTNPYNGANVSLPKGEDIRNIMHQALNIP
jgi:LCP family protein required for cell wall assembly